MKKSTLNLLLLLCLAPFLQQCVGENIKNLDLRMRNLDNRLVNTENALNSNASKNSIELMQQQQAKTADSVDALKKELLRINGKLEESSYFSSKLDEENKGVRDNMKSQINELYSKIETRIATLADRTAILESKVDQIMAMVDEMKEASARDASERAMAAARNLEEAKQKVAKAGEPPRITPSERQKKIVVSSSSATPEKTATPEKAKKGGGDLYEKALTAFNAKKYKEAYELFEEFTENNANDKRAANGLFYLGDCQFNLKEYEFAIVEYQKLLADYPNHDKAPTSLLRQGMSFEKINDKDTAKIVYQKLVDEYPKSEEAKSAKKQLERLK